MVPACEKSEKNRESDHLSKTVSIDSGPETRPGSFLQTSPLDEKEEHASTKESPPSTEHDEFEVYWNEPADQDPKNPMAWSNARKFSIIGLVSFVAFLTPLASAMFAPGIPQLMEDFHTSSNVLAAFVVSIFILGFAFGPLIIAPVSEIKGRSVVYHTCNIFFVIFTICNALATNMGMMMAFRFLAGFAGVGATTIGSGTIADMVPVQRRGFYMSIWSMGPIFGPMVGPIAGGFLIEKASWRWTFWVITIVAGISTILCWFVLRETLESVLLARKAAKLRKETGDPRWHPRGESKLTKQQLWTETLVRPMKILFLSPVASLMCIYIAVLYGLLYILFTTFTFVFKDQYNFSTQAAGLSYIGSGIGTLVGLIYTSFVSDRPIKAKLAKGIEPIPEDRLPVHTVLPGALLIPAGLFIYGWSAEYKVHWIVPQIGLTIQSTGTMLVLFCIQTYLVDSYGVHAASAIAACAVLRSFAGALVPLGGLKVYDALGIGWGNSLLGFITLGISPIPILFMLFGERLRNRHLKDIPKEKLVA